MLFLWSRCGLWHPVIIVKTMISMQSLYWIYSGKMSTFASCLCANPLFLASSYSVFVFSVCACVCVRAHTCTLVLTLLLTPSRCPLCHRSHAPRGWAHHPPGSPSCCPWSQRAQTGRSCAPCCPAGRKWDVGWERGYASNGWLKRSCIYLTHWLEIRFTASGWYNLISSFLM